MKIRAVVQIVVWPAVVKTSVPVARRPRVECLGQLALVRALRAGDGRARRARRFKGVTRRPGASGRSRGGSSPTCSSTTSAAPRGRNQENRTKGQRSAATGYLRRHRAAERAPPCDARCAAGLAPGRLDRRHHPEGGQRDHSQRPPTVKAGVEQDLAEGCAKDGQHAFLFASPLLTVVIGAGSPVNPAAIK